jgi:hypothetical protein
LLRAFQLFAQTDTTVQLVIVGAAMWKDQSFEIEAHLAKRIHMSINGHRAQVLVDNRSGWSTHNKGPVHMTLLHDKNVHYKSAD